MRIMTFTIKPTSIRFDLDSSDQIRHRTRGRGRVSRGQPCPTAVLKARGSSVPKFWTSYMRAHGTRNSIQVWHGDQTRCEKIFTGSTTPRPGKAFVTQMLTRDPFAVANLLVAITKSLKTSSIVNVLWKKMSYKCVSQVVSTSCQWLRLRWFDQRPVWFSGGFVAGHAEQSADAFMDENTQDSWNACSSTVAYAHNGDGADHRDSRQNIYNRHDETWKDECNRLL